MTRLQRRGRRSAGVRRAVRQLVEQLESRRLMCALHVGEEAAGDIWFDETNTSNIMRYLSAESAITGTPDLHSLPSAPAAIYLDFDGQGTREAYDIDGDLASFNTAEQKAITTAWSRVAAYFAMFNVDVTTTQPGTSGTPNKPFAWQLTTPDEGGWSYVNVFPDTSPQSFNNESSITSRTSAYAHELGHNFGNYHQGEYDSLGNNTAEYTDGYDILHGSIMGTDYARNIRKWFWGHDSTSDGASTLQDDMAVIAADTDLDGGDGYRPDEHASTIAGATALTVSGIDQVGAGVLERRADVDIFRFVSSGGRYNIEVGRAIESGVDVKIEIRDASNTLLGYEDVPLQPEANVAIDLPAGTYYLSVASHGNYGDLGMYDVRVSPMAAGFQTSDTGVTRRPGTASYNAASGTWTLVAGGSPSTTTTGTTDSLVFDEMRYAWTSLSGDGSIVARVNTMGMTDSSLAMDGDAFAGLMIRESLASNSKYALAARSPSGFRFEQRSTTGGSSSPTNVSASGPYWLRLTRVGNVFTASRSSDGQSWSTIGSATVAMDADVMIGVAASSWSDQQTITTSFDNLATTGGVGLAPTTSPSLAAPAGLAVSLGVGSGLSVAWNAVAEAVGGYLLQRSSDGSNFEDLATIAPGTTSYSDPNLAGSYRYSYRVHSLDSIGRSVASAVASAVNRPSAVTGVRVIELSTTMLTVDWIDTVGETGYRVERSADGGNTWTTVAASLSLNRPSYTDSSGLTANKSYQYRITPLSALGDGVTSTPFTAGTRLPAMAITPTATSSSVTLNWTDLNIGETGYKVERSTNNDTWTTLTTLGGDVTTYTQTGLSSLTRYYYRVQALTAVGEGTYAPAAVATLGTSSTPITPWETADIGDTDAPATTVSVSSGTYTMIANGSDIGTTSDDLHFMYQMLTGNGSITARVASLDLVDTGVDGAEVGIMFRTSLAAGSPYAMAIITNDDDSRFNRRGTLNGSTTSNDGPNKANGDNVDAPYWLRLSRTGNVILAEQSADGVTWVQLGTATVDLGTTIYAGLALSSQSSVTMARATFSNVTLTGGTSDTTPPVAPVFGAISTDTGASNTDRITSDATLILNGTAEANSTVKISLGGNQIGTATANGSGAWTFDYTATTLIDGVHAFSATATDAANNTGPAAAMNVTVDTVSNQLTNAVFDRQTGHSWHLTFSDAVQTPIATGAVTVKNLLGSETYPLLMTGYDAGTNTATFTLENGGRLIDSTYRLVLTAMADTAGNAVATSGASMDFSVIVGDLNGDGRVNFTDLLAVAQNYGKTVAGYAQGNIDYDPDNMVDFTDLLLLAQHYGRVAAPPPAAAFATTAATTGAAARRSSATGVFNETAAAIV